MKNINMKDLARELKVSIATVSKALHDSHEISVQTKRKVLEAAARLNYTMNPYASSLRKKKSKTIAVILPEVADNFFSLAINGIQAVAEKKGYHVLIYLSHENYLIEKALVAECGSGRVDGILLSVSSETTAGEHISTLQQRNVPVVFFDRDYEGLAVSKVITNDFDSGYLSAKHLLAEGCQHPVFLSISANLSICNKRAAGFRRALEESGRASAEKSIITCKPLKEGMNVQLKKLLSGRSRPDGVVASVERLAMSLYLLAAELGIAIPQDLKVMAFSTMEMAPILNPPLTTIVQPAFDIGRAAAEVLFKKIEKKKNIHIEEIIVLPSVLVQRASSGRN